MLRPIGSFLPEALGRLKVKKPVEATLVCRACDTALGDLWDHAVPMRSVSFVGGTVTIAVTGSAWAHEVLTKGEQIKDAANKSLGGAAVKVVKTRVAPTAARGDST